MNRRYNPALYYQNYIPNTLNRPMKDRPKRMTQWSYLEKTSYNKSITENEEILEYIHRNNEAPEGTPSKQIKELKALKLVSQRGKGLCIHKLAADYFDDED